MEGEEIWVDSPDIDGAKVSSWGRIWLPAVVAEMPNGGFRSYQTRPIWGHKRRASKSARHTFLGLLYRGKNYKIHRLVCSAFHGPAPFERAIVMHIDENPLNNRPDNLRWGTQKENMNAAGFIAYCKSRTGENSPGIKAKTKRAAG